LSAGPEPAPAPQPPQPEHQCLMNYCQVGWNGTGEVAASLARPDHRESKFGLRWPIELN
jgi:hypothetical protein